MHRYLAIPTTLFLVALGISCSTAPKQEDSSTMVSATQVPEGAVAGPIRYDYKPGEITRLCDQSETKATTRIASIVALAPSKRTFANTMGALEALYADLSDETSALTFMGYVSLDAKLRDEATACEEKVGKFRVSIMTRKDLYNAVKDVTPKGKDEKRLLSQWVKHFEKNGLKLPDAQLEQVKEKMQALASLETQFQANLNSDVSSVEFTAEEMAGAPESFLQRLKKSADGKRYVVTTKMADYQIFMEQVKSAESRRKMMDAYVNRAAAKNTVILADALRLRREAAAILGYKTWADFQTSDRMAKDSTTVMTFLDGLRDKLSIREKKDLAALLEFKRTIDPKAERVDAWDINYLAYQLKLKKFNLDDEVIREYFPAEQTVQGIFQVYSKLLDVQFVEVKRASPWSPDVKLYEIWDGKRGIIAYFYADFYPRPGKYSHAAAFTLRSGRRLADGKYSKPVSAIVANFNPPGGGKPSLMNHGEVETLFHEFGHIMHQVLTTAPYASLSGSETARDFVEAPSQMLEEWVWQPEILRKVSGHYADATKKLPETIIKQLIKARDFNRGYFYTRQLMLGLLDMTYHTSPEAVDPTDIYMKLHESIMGIPSIAGSHFPASFGHLLGGYDAGYYGYLWSEVYAQDMATRFKAAGFLNTTVGKQYRKHILERGDMEDAMDLISKFLKRKPNNKAFLKMLGITRAGAQS